MSSSWKSFSHVHCRANLPNICLWDALQVASLPQIENKQEGGKKQSDRVGGGCTSCSGLTGTDMTSDICDKNTDCCYWIAPKSSENKVFIFPVKLAQNIAPPHPQPMDVAVHFWLLVWVKLLCSDFQL